MPKYQDPLVEIDDLAGVRIITFFPGSIEAIETMIGEEFDIFERSDKSEALIEEGRFGYQSIHYLVTLKDTRTQLVEYARFDRAIIELQVRTILQHAWAEIEHDIQYKSTSAIPHGSAGDFSHSPVSLNLPIENFKRSKTKIRQPRSKLA